MKKILLTTTILGSASLLPAMGLAQAPTEPDATQAQDACAELISYMEEENAQATELTIEEAEALQAQGDTEACREELQRVAAADDDERQAAAGQDQPTDPDQLGQQDEPTEGAEFAEGEPADPDDLAQQDRPDDAEATAQQPDDGERDEDGRIVVEQDAPAVDVEQPAPQVAVEQPQPQVTVRQPQPEIEVRQPAPTVTIEQPEPEITVRMPEPEVEVTMPEPRVAVDQPQPEVEVRQPDEPQVQVQEEQQAQVQTEPAQQAETSIEREGEPQVSYQRAEEPEVVFQQSEEGPQVQVERMEGEETAEAAQPDGEEREQAATAAERDAGDPVAVEASQLIGTTLVSDQGEEIGTVEQVIFAEADQEHFLVVSTGGFMGEGESQIALSIEDVVVEDGQLVAPNVSQEDIADMPEWDADQVTHQELEPDQTAEVAVRN